MYNKDKYLPDIKKRAKELVSQMTLREKVAQTLHAAPAIPRLGIKAYNWWNEALHGVARAGVATVFPQAIGLAATFDEDFMHEVADVISTEGRAKFNMQQKFNDTDIYKGLTFWSPNINIFRDPRWGRGHETLGEDPYLTTRMGVRFIEGLQGDDEKYIKVAACAKHYAVHSGPEDLRHSFNAEISKQDLYETYLSAFKACVQEAKVEGVMGAYNRVNGEPACGSRTLLKEILRKDWGFDGYVTSDCWAIKDFHEHHKVTNSPVESVALAMNEGCDLNCGNIFVCLEDAVNQGLVNEKRLDEAVETLLTIKMKLGIFDDQEKVPFSKITYSVVDCKEHRMLNKKAAQKSVVLLKNDGILPLNKQSLKTIGVIGPNANNRRALVGNYEGTASEYVTVLEGIQEYVGDSVRVMYSEGCHLCLDKTSGLSMPNDRLSEVKEICEESDVIIGCFGLDSGLEGEEGDQGNQFASGDKPDLKLPGIQEDIIKTMYESNKPVILVLLSGSALAIGWEAENLPAIIQGWYPGAQGGRAIASILFGDYSPEGKLPVTFYRTTEELPAFTDYAMKDRTYRYMKQEALFPFGFGLSYTSFEIKKAFIDTDLISPDGEIKCTVEIANTGAIKGAETIQIYIKALQDNTPNPQLKCLKKVELEPGEKKTVEMLLPAKAFGLYDENGQFMLYKGEYEIYIGTSQPDSRSIGLTGKKPIVKKVKALATGKIEA